MPLSIALLAAQAAVQATPSAPPPIAVTNTAPPPMIVAVPSDRPPLYAIPEANNAAPDLLDLRIRAGSETLWEGTLSVARPGASMIQHLNQTEPDGCPPSAYAHSVHSSLSVSVLREKLSITPANAFSYQLRVSWERPSSPRGCGNEGARKVEISQNVDLRPGQSATLKGDVGLVVEARRR